MAPASPTTTTTPTAATAAPLGMLVVFLSNHSKPFTFAAPRYIVGEHTLRVRHCLLALPGVKKGEVKRVLSHPQALAQCDNYIRSLRAKREPKYDTAGSAKFIKEEGLRDCAAIASDLAAEIYGMAVLEAGIEVGGPLICI